MCVLREKEKGGQVFLLWKKRWTVYIISSYFTAQINCGATFHLRKLGGRKLLFFAVTIRLLLHNSFSAAAMAAEKGRGGGGKI